MVWALNNAALPFCRSAKTGGFLTGATDALSAVASRGLGRYIHLTTSGVRKSVETWAYHSNDVTAAERQAIANALAHSLDTAEKHYVLRNPGVCALSLPRVSTIVEIIKCPEYAICHSPAHPAANNLRVQGILSAAMPALKNGGGGGRDQPAAATTPSEGVFPASSEASKEVEDSAHTRTDTDDDSYHVLTEEDDEYYPCSQEDRHVDEFLPSSHGIDQESEGPGWHMEEEDTYNSLLDAKLNDNAKSVHIHTHTHHHHYSGQRHPPPPPPPPPPLKRGMPVVTPAIKANPITRSPLKRRSWDDVETSLLLAVVVASASHDSSSSCADWTKVSLKMRQNGFQRSNTNCKDRIRHLLKTRNTQALNILPQEIKNTYRR